METAPKGSTVTDVFKASSSARRISYFSVTSYRVDERLNDCWADPDDEDDDIELDDAAGWQPDESDTFKLRSRGCGWCELIDLRIAVCNTWRCNNVRRRKHA